MQIEKASASPNGVGVLPSTTEDAVIIMRNRPNVGWNDGIPDQWRIQYFGTLATLDAHPDGDPDGDGVTTAQEFQLGSNPTDASDHLRVQARNTGGAINVTFRTAAGRKYRLESSVTLKPGSWNTVQSDILGTGSEVELSNSSESAHGYYRVMIQE